MPAHIRKTDGYKAYSHKGKGGKPLSKKAKSKKAANAQAVAANISMGYIKPKKKRK